MHISHAAAHDAGLGPTLAALVAHAALLAAAPAAAGVLMRNHAAIMLPSMHATGAFLGWQTREMQARLQPLYSAPTWVASRAVQRSFIRHNFECLAESESDSGCLAS